MPVPPRVSLVTLGVDDLPRSTAFYTALGWALSPASTEAVSFFRTGGAILALFGTEDLVAETGTVSAVVPGFRGVTLAINVESAVAVDAAVEDACRAGATLVKAPSTAEWGGHVGYFADPDGHVWEVAYNPGFPLGGEGLPQLP
ncbi:MAG TPA: VOC family protein [Mycobacteriales bacterium]|jgi:catechol 2,3-dioxygenase-like lactoylglutathione lyase family enzyme|nr:VOC family protein [Mycobacteriales bacterium]